jgi:hypothetical protein
VKEEAEKSRRKRAFRETEFRSIIALDDERYRKEKKSTHPKLQTKKKAKKRS